MKTYLIVFGMAILFHPFCSASADADFQNQPGWTWLVKPRSIDPPSWANSGVLGIVEQDRNSALIVTVTWRPTEGVEYRVIAFDVEGNRYLPEMRRLGVGSNGVQLTRFQFSLDLIRYEDVMHVGFEALRQEQRHVASQHAADRANQSGIEVLPFPQLNKSYPFTLTTVDGRSINQKEFSGKVVLFDCWAATCMPCMKDMPNILNTYNKWHASGLDIIGVNFDVNWNKAQHAILKNKLVWPQIHVPGEEKLRAIWYEVSGIRDLPRVLLLDRQGYLRADANSFDEIKATLEELMEQEG